MTPQFDIVKPDGEKANITGRDKFVMMQSLLYAIAHIQSLPPNSRDVPLMCDMCTLARAFGGLSLSYLIENVKGFIGHGEVVDLYPKEDPNLD